MDWKLPNPLGTITNLISTWTGNMATLFLKYAHCGDTEPPVNVSQVVRTEYWEGVKDYSFSAADLQKSHLFLYKVVKIAGRIKRKIVRLAFLREAKRTI